MLIALFLHRPTGPANQTLINSELREEKLIRLIMALRDAIVEVFILIVAMLYGRMGCCISVAFWSCDSLKANLNATCLQAI